jgi:NAD(P)H dehydrogenase (quinone)
MKIGVSGASGKLGAGVLDYLGKRPGVERVGISRTPSETAGYETRFGDYARSSTLRRPSSCGECSSVRPG